MDLELVTIWTGGKSRRFGPAARAPRTARGDTWRGWTLWITEDELEKFEAIVAGRAETPEEQGLQAELLVALASAREHPA